MRIKLALALWLLALSAAWWATLPPDLALLPLIDAQGAARGLWRLRDQAIVLSGLYSVGLMSLIMLLALRLPLIERPLGGMDQVYRLHKWAGIGAGLTAVLHWGLKEGGGLIKTLWGRAGKPPHEAVLPWLSDARGLAKDLGEWGFYLLLVLLAVTLIHRLLAYRPWRVSHRAMAVLYLVFVFHTLALLPLHFWAPPLGWLMGGLLALGSLAALASLVGVIGLRRRHAARIHSVQRLGTDADAPLEVVCALPPSWPGHRAGQFAFVRFERAEGAHPFTIASAPGALGCTADGAPLLRLVIKPLGDYTQVLHQRLRAGQALDIEGPYGHFDGQGQAQRQQVWVAAGVGVTPFIALLEARQPGAPTPIESAQPVHMHYCTRNAARDPLLDRLRTLCAQAEPPVALTVHDDAQGQRLRPQDLEQQGQAIDLWFCGPQGLGDALAAHTRRAPWRLHRELFAMR